MLLQVKYRRIFFAALIATILLGSFLEYLPGISCPFENFLGICCPMCGTTRAWKSLLLGDIITAVKFNPMFIVWGWWCLVCYLDLLAEALPNTRIREVWVSRISISRVSQFWIYLHLAASSLTVIYLNHPAVHNWREMKTEQMFL